MLIPCLSLSLISSHNINFQVTDISSDRVALIGKKRLIVEEDIELGGSRGERESGDRDRNPAPPPPPWIDDLLDIRYNCTLISQKCKELDSLQNHHVQRPTFDDDAGTELQIEEVTQNITRVSQGKAASPSA